MQKISHYDLCKKTAEWQLEKSRIILYEYQSFSTNEFPDVLCFKNGNTWLYEIKVNYQDFKRDSGKDCRVEKKIKYFPRLNWTCKTKLKIDWESSYMKRELKEFYVEAPHLGRERFYMCPADLIQPEEIKNGWGLYWYNGKSFRKKKDSKKFKANIYDEMRILEHAFRKNHCGDGNNILVNGYK